MHELSLLQGVVTAVEKAAVDSGATGVERVGLRVGTMSGAVPEALDSALPLAAVGTLAEGALLELEVLIAAVWCPTCEAEQEIDEFYALTCPQCGTPTGDLVRGREFEVVFADVTH